MASKEFFGLIATIIGIIGFLPYLRSIFAGKTKPHAFSWLVWASIMGVAFAVQYSTNAGAGAWVTGAQAAMNLVIFLLALFVGKLSFPLFDWFALASAAIAFLLWRITDNPLLAVVLLSLTDAAGFLPTYRKGFQKPFDDSITVYAFSAIAYVFTIFAMESLTLTNWLYPATLIVTNGFCVTLFLVRRKIVRKAS